MLKQRVLTALVLAPVVLAAIFYLPTAWLSLLLAGVMVVGVRELALLAGATSSSAQAAVMAVTATGIALVAVFPQWQNTALWIAIVSWLLCFAWLIMPHHGQALAGRWRVIKVLLAIIMTVPAWVAIQNLHQLHPGWLISLLFLVWAADVGAYAAGKTLGRHKLAPSVSPGKTWEGLVGGVITALALMLCAAHWTGYWHQPLWFLPAAVVLITLISVVGDLTVSLLKRHAGSKDTGALLPGHGGLMDRIDSLCAAAPFFALALEWWRHYW
jgi:phosphatidate cytidylyltransferase